MLRQAAADLDLDLARSFVVGDRWHDLGAGAAVGARGILVRSGLGAAEERRPTEVRAAVIVDDLAAAAAWILEATQQPA